MKSYSVVADGFSRVHIASHNSAVFPVTSEQQAYLDEFIVRKSRETGATFYDGDMVGVPAGELSAAFDELTLGTRRMKYSQHAGLFRMRADAPIQALYVSGIVVTSDNRFVLGTAQATEKQWMDRINIPAGLVQVSPGGFPSLGAELYRELFEELGLLPDFVIGEIMPVCMHGPSRREGNFHYSVPFFVPLKMDEARLRSWFEYWTHGLKSFGETPEFASLNFYPNEPAHIKRMLEEEDAKSEPQIIGRALDIVEEWAGYECDPEKLRASKTHVKFY